MIDRLTEADRPRWTGLWTAYLDFYNTVLPPEQYDYTWQRLMSGTLDLRLWLAPRGPAGRDHALSFP